MVVIIINNVYYSGNFWWTNKYHLTKLPDKIDTYYTAPEDWILLNKYHEDVYKHVYKSETSLFDKIKSFWF